MASYCRNPFGHCPSSAGETKGACSVPGWGGLVFLNCFSAEQLLYQYSDLQGCQRRVKNRKRDEASFRELPFPLRHTGTCVILCPFGKHGQHDSPHLRTLASWSFFCLSFSINLVKPAPQHSTNSFSCLVPPDFSLFSRGEGHSLCKERSYELDVAVQKAAQ